MVTIRQGMDFFARERAGAIAWARDLIERSNTGDWLIVDTETTGTDDFAEAVEVAILAPDGRLEVSYRLRPTILIPPEATRIHGITNAMVAESPRWPELHVFLCQTLHPREVVCYNAAFDVRILTQSAAAWNLPTPVHVRGCAMLQYARFVGEWNDYRGNFRWQKLPPLPGQTAHSALADCRSTLALIRKMAEARE